MIKHLDIKVYGFVQGVFFRDFARKKAQEFNITGFVRNELDGSVCIEAEGEEKDLDGFIQWMRQGTEFAKVTGIDVQEGSLRKFGTFMVQ